MNISELYSKVRSFDDRALAKAASLIEDRQVGYLDLLQQLYPHTGSARILGVTGAPGSGKSTLINALAIELTKQGQRIAVIAVDPSSPISQGAVLGDRIRMKSAADNKNVFVRSISSRGQGGGIALALADLIDLFDAAGFNYVLVETVGVGQVEIDVYNLVDLLILTLTPGMGDEVQAMKAGILELADIFVLNKSDQPGADLLEAILKSAALSTATDAKALQFVRTIATQGQGVPELAKVCSEHFLALDVNKLQNRRTRLLRQRIFQELVLKLKAYSSDNEVSFYGDLVQQCEKRQIHPALVASQALSRLGIK